MRSVDLDLDLLVQQGLPGVHDLPVLGGDAERRLGWYVLEGRLPDQFVGSSRLPACGLCASFESTNAPGAVDGEDGVGDVVDHRSEEVGLARPGPLQLRRKALTARSRAATVTCIMPATNAIVANSSTGLTEASGTKNGAPPQMATRATR